MKRYEPQPAHLMYAFDGGWQVMKYVRENVFSRTGAEAEKYYKRAKDEEDKAKYQDSVVTKYWQYSIVAGYYLAGVSQYISALTLVLVFYAIQFVLLVTWSAISYLLIALLAAVNFLHGHYYKIFFRCPNCHEQMTIPIYLCPTCGAEHTRLWPSVYGVFRHRCSKCDTRLRTLDAHGRKDLVQKCVECGRPMNKEIGRLINVHIPVIGGPSTGKSNFIITATRKFIEDYAPSEGFDVDFPDVNDQRLYDTSVQRLSSGRALVKTPNIIPQAYNLAVEKSKERIGRILYVYDAAGEAYSTDDNAALQSYFDYVHGLIFIIDPFSIDFFRRRNEDRIKGDMGSLRPSSSRPMEAYERMLTILESKVAFKEGRKYKHPLAVVVSKTDALDLENQIGQTAAKALMQTESSICLEEDAISILIEQFLIDQQSGNLVRDIRLQFQNVKFFSVSALGRMPDRNDQRPFEPERVLLPLLWVLGQLRIVNARRDRVRSVDAKHWSVGQSMNNLFQSVKYYYWDSLRPRES